LYHDLIIVGGGASGIIAAITAHDMGADVALVEGGDRIGKKILATGNGRCNITNENCEDFRYHSANPGFFRHILSEFTYKDTKNFFSSIGLPLITLEDGKLFPMSLQASSVLDILRMALEERNIPIYLNSKVTEVNCKNNAFTLYTNSKNNFECRRIILACGGKSAASTGSDGSGFEIGRKFGHTLITPVPALVQMKLDYKNIKALSGIKFEGSAEIYVDNVSKRKEFGEILFTDYGISGPPILQLSRIASRASINGDDVKLSVDFIPAVSRSSLEELLESRWGMFAGRSIHDSFIGIINKKLIPILIKEAGITNIHEPCYMLQWNEKRTIYSLLKSWQFRVTGTNPFKDSQVTSGGINTKEVNSETLESKLIPGLYFSGELLDVDADCGGFNLQWAWSSGFAAAKNACLK
jgi:predicted Rossmann fold flavoprotein